MEQASDSKIYNKIGGDYRRFRVPDPRIALQIRLAVGNASTVCNIGAGTGAYEPTDLKVTPVEPSERMIQQRSDSMRVIRAGAEDLPFDYQAFDVAMAVLTVHHWTDQVKGLKEMQRVSRKQVIMTFDPLLVDTCWLVRDYLPEFATFEKKRAVTIDTFRSLLGPCHISPVMIPWDCSDGFLAAYWRRPEWYLNSTVRNAISSFAQLPSEIVTKAITRLARDIESGAWKERYADLLECDAMDFGYRLIVADSPE